MDSCHDVSTGIVCSGRQARLATSLHRARTKAVQSCRATAFRLWRSNVRYTLRMDFTRRSVHRLRLR